MLKALNDKVIVKPIKEELQKVGGIFLPISANEQLPRGEVVSVGPKVNIDVKIGDIVILPNTRYSRIPLKCDNVEYELIAQENLIGVIEKEEIVQEESKEVAQ